ncbi:MAG: esterase/lipase family protein [Desulfobaccales bacterium]
MSRRMIGKLLLLLLLAVVLLIPAVSEAAAPRLGVVLLHGKTGKPAKLWVLSSGLEAQGFLVSTPAMPWSFNRYLDASFETALDEIAAAITQLKQKGATKIVVAGHSMGANAALAYAANRGGVDGVIMLAPGHWPDLPRFQQRVQEGVAKAREMVQSGRGTQTAEFPDINQGKPFLVNTQAQIYLSYFAPDGLGAMGRNAARLDAKIPLLVVVGDKDTLNPQTQAKDYIFTKAPANPLSQFVVVSADHLGTPAAAEADVVRWLKSLPN